MLSYRIKWVELSTGTRGVSAVVTANTVREIGGIIKALNNAFPTIKHNWELC